MRTIVLFLFACLWAVTACHSAPKKVPVSGIETVNKHSARDRAIEVVQKSSGVYHYTFKGDNVLKPLLPYEDFLSKKKITNTGLIKEIKGLLKENKSWNPEYRKRCLPKWEYGLEFRKSKTEKRMVLFSFACSTMMLYDEKVFRDFEPQKVRLYGLLKYQVNDKTANDLK